MRILFAVLISVALATGTPVERKSDGPMVVDVPAGMFDETEADDIASLPSSQNKEVEIIQPSSDSVEVVEEDNKKPETNGGLIPTIFIIRRPVISERFPFFQSESPFQSFRPFSFFENRRRPTFQIQNQRPSDSDDAQGEGESTQDMVAHMEQMMKRMQQQMSSLWGSFLSPSFQRPLRPVFPSIESGEIDNSNETTVFNIDKLPANYTNSTSETKVVDGHVVQVNKTIHKISSGNNNSGFFHFEVINVRPTEGTKTESPIPEASDVKPVPEIPSITQPEPEQPKVEDPSLNEVGGGVKKNTDDNRFPFLVNRGRPYYDDEDENSEVEWIPRTEYQRPSSPWALPRSRSLNDDLRVNRLVQNQGRRSPFLLLNPDVELLDV